MSKLAELITELCPNGVAIKRIKELSSYRRGSFPQPYGNAQWYDGEGAMPFVQVADIGDDMKLVDNTKSKISLIAQPKSVFAPKGSIIISLQGSIGRIAITQYDAFIDRTVAIFQDISEALVPKYFVYQLQRIFAIKEKTARGSTIKTITKEEFTEFLIPLPPLPVQREIVKILDNFTELIAELKAELQKRREQYRHYSTVLFDDAKKSGVHSIEEICHIEKGNTPIQKAIPGGYPMVVTTTERKSCDTYQFNTKAVCVPLVSSRGHGVASLNHVYYQEGKFALGNILCAIIPKNEEQVYPKYLYYYFEQTKDYTLVPLMKGGANVALHINDVKKVKVPIPSLEEQKRIVDILSRFDTLCNDSTIGLPAEIDARQKQFEYYYDKLLTFKELS